MATQAATARLELDARGFDKQANASFREFSKQLTSVKDATDLAMRGAEALQKTLVKSLAGTAAIGAASVLSDAIRDVGAKLHDAAEGARQAAEKINQLGSLQGLQQGTEAATALQQSLQKTNETLTAIETSPLQNFVASVSGAKDAMQQLSEATQREIDLTLQLAAAAEKRRAVERGGMTDGQRQRADLQAGLERDASRTLAQIKDPNLRAKAQADLTAANAAKLADFDRKQGEADQKKANDAGLKSESEQRNAADARRKRDMDDFQRALDRQNERTAGESARMLQEAMEKLELNAKLVELNAEKLDLKGQEAAAQKEKQDIQAAAEGQSLSASRQGQQFLKSAQRRRAEANRRDNFKFNQEMAANRAAEMTSQSAAMANELMALRQLAAREGSTATDRTGRTIGDRIREIERSGMVDPSFGAKRFSPGDAQKRMADEQAARDDKSMRDQFTTDMSGVEDKLKDIREQLSKTLDEIANYSHAGAN